MTPSALCREQGFLSPLRIDENRNSQGNLPANQNSAPISRYILAQELSFTAEDISVVVGQPVHLNLKILGDYSAKEFTFFTIVGLPEGFRMSAGFPTKNGWLVSIRDYDNLRIIPTDRFVGEIILQIILFKGKNAIPQAQTIAANIRPREEPPIQSLAEAPVSAIQPAPEVLPAPSVILPKPQISEEEERNGMERAREVLKSSDISAARLIYESLAMKGSADAAFAMARTFDPEFYRDMPAAGLKPNIETARQWYQKAAELGSLEASERLATLRTD